MFITDQNTNAVDMMNLLFVPCQCLDIMLALEGKLRVSLKTLTFILRG